MGLGETLGVLGDYNGSEGLRVVLMGLGAALGVLMVFIMGLGETLGVSGWF